MKNNKTREVFITIVACVLVCVIAYLIGYYTAPTKTEIHEVETIKYVEVIREVKVYPTEEETEEHEKKSVDTSTIEGDTDLYGVGKMRMVRAWWYSDNAKTADTTVEDETGSLWNISDVPVGENDYLLLWILDNNTPEDVTDDEVCQVWVEPIR